MSTKVKSIPNKRAEKSKHVKFYYSCVFQRGGPFGAKEFSWSMKITKHAVTLIR